MKMVKLATLALAAMLARPALADVFVAGNAKTLDVLVVGNSEDAAERMANQAFGIRQDGWIQLWQGDEAGWIAVSCVRRSDGGTHFEFATAQPSEAIATDLARSAARQYIDRSGGSLIDGCGASFENRGQLAVARFAAAPVSEATPQLATSGDRSTSNAGSSRATASSPDRRQSAADGRASDRQQVLSSTAIERPPAPVLLNNRPKAPPAPPASSQASAANLGCTVHGEQVVNLPCRKTAAKNGPPSGSSGSGASSSGQFGTGGQRSGGTTSSIRLAYWGNINTGDAVLVVNMPNADLLARAEVQRRGGSGWVQIIASDQIGYGAAQCISTDTPRKRVYFFVEHGYPDQASAYNAARFDAAGAVKTYRTDPPVACSYPSWHVRGG